MAGYSGTPLGRKLGYRDGLAAPVEQPPEGYARLLQRPAGLVDLKVGAVDQTWSGLKLMIRKERR